MRMIAPTDSILALLSLKSEPELFIWRTINSDSSPHSSEETLVSYEICLDRF